VLSFMTISLDSACPCHLGGADYHFTNAVDART
jgi:hypothetical protein